ncbi:hypothetical protein DFH08DRAFT_940432 [Mycena albidolilacea]|uniref:Uncharacterized protein n=1 Tax=Mycena albidolilacea TaxID=1033008 RepID=A0AAD6ZMK0_9AGAR|nr:hypothetical protein DFH08DRAFT_940432 [Mycena albidolilacea]
MCLPVMDYTVFPTSRFRLSSSFSTTTISPLPGPMALPVPHAYPNATVQHNCKRDKGRESRALGTRRAWLMGKQEWQDKRERRGKQEWQGQNSIKIWISELLQYQLMQSIEDLAKARYTAIPEGIGILWFRRSLESTGHPMDSNESPFCAFCGDYSSNEGSKWIENTIYFEFHALLWPSMYTHHPSLALALHLRRPLNRGDTVQAQSTLEREEGKSEWEHECRRSESDEGEDAPQLYNPMSLELTLSPLRLDRSGTESFRGLEDQERAGGRRKRETIEKKTHQHHDTGPRGMHGPAEFE